VDQSLEEDANPCPYGYKRKNRGKLTTINCPGSRPEGGSTDVEVKVEDLVSSMVCCKTEKNCWWLDENYIPEYPEPRQGRPHLSASSKLKSCQGSWEITQTRAEIEEAARIQRRAMRQEYRADRDNNYNHQFGHGKKAFIRRNWAKLKAAVKD
jgi:hypothetical protein